MATISPGVILVCLAETVLSAASSLLVSEVDNVNVEVVAAAAVDFLGSVASAKNDDDNDNDVVVDNEADITHRFWCIID